jgi:hypothetical protein
LIKRSVKFNKSEHSETKRIQLALCKILSRKYAMELAETGDAFKKYSFISQNR